MSTRLSSSGRDAIDPVALHALYERDETAWLEVMARLAEGRRGDELDYENLGEFLRSMANRDRREVMSRLMQLLMHRLKWEHQVELRTSSWRRSIRVQRLELLDLLESGTLRNHAQEILPEAYRRAVSLAADETGMDESAFPEEGPQSIDDVLKDD